MHVVATKMASSGDAVRARTLFLQAIDYSGRHARGARRGEWMKTMFCVTLALLLAGCIPIGVRGSTQFATAVAAPMAADR